MLVLSGIAVIALGFLLRFNPLLVVAASALATGLAAGIDPIALLATFGQCVQREPLRHRDLSGAAGHRPPRTLRVAGAGAGARGGDARRDARTAAGRLHAAAAGVRGAGAERGRRASADGATVGRADGRGGGGAGDGGRRGERGRAGDGGGDRQCRAVLRRGHLPRGRIDPADEGRAGRNGRSRRAAGAFGLGDPDRVGGGAGPRRALLWLDRRLTRAGSSR